MLVSATEMLQKAKAGHYAVGQFNINNLEWTKAILLTAQECNSPLRRMYEVYRSRILIYHVRWITLSDRGERREDKRAR